MNIRSVMAAILLACATGEYIHAQEASTVEALQAILSELREIRTRLDRSPQQPAEPARQISLNVGNAPFIGRADAPLTIVNFTDFQCPYCNQFYRQTYGDLKKVFVDTGKVRFYSMDLPLSRNHPNAMGAAMAGRCASEQGQFWAMHDHMQGNPEALSSPELVTFAQSLGIDDARFRKCIESNKYAAEIEKDMRMASSLGVSGTPAFVVGKSTLDGVDGQIVMGAVPLGIFQRALEKVELEK